MSRQRTDSDVLRSAPGSAEFSEAKMPIASALSGEPRDTVKLTPEQEKARKVRNIMIAAGLLAFVALVYVVTIVRLGENVADRTF